MTATTIAVDRVDGRHVARLRHGLLRPQIVSADAGRCRIGLLATTALLLGGDTVELDVRVGPGARLDLFDVAGTVAYHGRGQRSAWHVRLDLAEGATLTYAAEPFVVADGADVTRTLETDLADGAGAVLRDTLVLGRTGQPGGRIHSVTDVRWEGKLVLREAQHLDAAGLRRSPGMLGAHRVLDTVTWLGTANTTPPSTSSGQRADATTYALLDGAGTVARWLGSSLAESPLHTVDLARAGETVRPLRQAQGA